MFTARIDDVML